MSYLEYGSDIIPHASILDEVQIETLTPSSGLNEDPKDWFEEFSPILDHLINFCIVAEKDKENILWSIE